ncbi:cytochrome P450 [Streptacidiphilus fuscans]|nr:cytochrome P450 [Streptacidiphilus fuscans]
MTSPADSSSAPAFAPRGCPAHAGGSQSVPMYGAEVEADARGFYERMRREHGPVAPVLLPGDIPAWLVTGHSEILEVVRTPSKYSRDSRRWNAFQQGLVAPDSPLMPMLAWQPLCVFADGGDHQRLRGAVTRGLDRFDRRGVRRYVTRYADQLVDGFCQKGEADLIGQFSEHLPMLVMTQLFGMPDEAGPQLVNALRDLMKGTETALASNAYVVEVLSKLVADRRRTPRQDLPSWLLLDEAELTDEEVVEHLRLILVAANETTVNLIANVLRVVLTDPAFRRSLAGGQLQLPDALEMVLWDDPPLAVVPGRWAVNPTRLGEVDIHEGDLLMLALGAGNVDPRVRPDVTASVAGNRAHLAFSGGPHECPGADVGRAIAETGIDVLLARLPDLQLSVPEGELRWTSSWLARHLAELPVDFTPVLPKPAPAAATPSAYPQSPQQAPATPYPAYDPASAPFSSGAVSAPAVGGPTRRVPWWRRLLSLLQR